MSLALRPATIETVPDSRKTRARPLAAVMDGQARAGDRYLSFVISLNFRKLGIAVVQFGMAVIGMAARSEVCR
jgi:hypothetical protein